MARHRVFRDWGAEGTNYSIFLRKTDGSPAIRLGDGGFARFSGWPLGGIDRRSTGEVDVAAYRRRRTEAAYR